jgi:cell wall-associated NlpC family hydrolase
MLSISTRLRSCALICILLGLAALSAGAHADEVQDHVQLARQALTLASELPATVFPAATPGLIEQAGKTTQSVISQAFDLIGTRYRRGGNTPDTGFDCSGFVKHVYGRIGEILPRTAREMSQIGTWVGTNELRPGDLVFFNTMRKTFSHVGIYLGDNQFIHAPARGGAVRIDDMRQNYWTQRFNGARRIEQP